MNFLESIKNLGLNTFEKVKKFSGKNSAELFLAGGVLTFGVSELLAIRATRDSMNKIAELKKEQYLETGNAKLTRKHIVKATWRNYIEPAATFVMGAGFIACGANEYSSRNVALATALGVSQGMLNDYKKKTIEALGSEEERKKITEELAKDKIKSLKSDDDITATGKGEVLFYDSCTGHLFKSSKNSIREAVNTINERIFDEVFIEYSELCWEIGFDGGYLSSVNGWNVADGKIVVNLSEASVTDDGIPFVIMDFLVRPSGSYRNR